jgi:hypothetical protein
LTQVPQGGSVYERWVLTLRAWAKEPERTPLDGLPALDDSTFTPDTYGRFVDHVLDAMRQANERWHRGLSRAWETSATPHELAREMVALRITLARRLQLARHPGLPGPIRDSLLAGLRGDIERYQTETEDAVRNQRSATTVDSSWRDQMLAVVRENSFLAVLDYDVSGRRPQAAPLPERDPYTPIAAPARPSYRRIVPIREG